MGIPTDRIGVYGRFVNSLPYCKVVEDSSRAKDIIV